MDHDLISRLHLAHVVERHEGDQPADARAVTQPFRSGGRGVGTVVA